MLRTGEFLVAILLVTTAGLVCRAVGAAPPQDNSQDWAQVKPVSPSELTRGSPVQITVEVEYNLVTLDSGLLYLYLAQSVGGCSGSDHRLLYPEVEIPIQRGRHKIKTLVMWPGDTGEGLNRCILGNGYVGFVPMLFAEENGNRTRLLSRSSLTGCIPFYASASRPPTRPITVSASIDPQAIAPGGTSVVTVTAKAPDGSMIPNARVVVFAGFGTFNDSGTSWVIGHTNDQGLYSTTWKSPPPGARYTPTVGMSACAFKEGFQGGQQSGLQVTVKTDQPPQPPPPPQNAWSGFAGSWVNANPQTAEIASLRIYLEGQQWIMDAGVPCGPRECSWGLARATLSGNQGTVEWHLNGGTQRMEILRQGDRLTVDLIVDSVRHPRQTFVRQP